MKTVFVAGTRPNFIKISPLLEAAAEYPHLDVTLVHTGQHYDYAMSRSFFEQLRIREPDIFLEVGSGSHGDQTGRVLAGFETVLTGLEPELVVVVGDVNSTLACALAASKMTFAKKTPAGLRRPLVAHVESGLRSFDRAMPEEINRLLTDAISDYLFTTCREAGENLCREGVPPEKIHFTGNVMVDTLLKNRGSAVTPPLLEGIEGRYALVTLHRPSNVDEFASFRPIAEALRELADDLPVVFPAHPRTQNMIREFGLECRLGAPGEGGTPARGGVSLVNPLPYLEFIGAMEKAAMVLTDSGGIQEETTVLSVPCLTVRENTERPITVEIGTNTLVGTSRERILEEARRILKEGIPPHELPELWDGRAAARIMAVLAVR